MKYKIAAIILLLASVATAEDTRKWYAMAYAHDGRGFRYESYGVAWNFPTRAAAESAAVAECEKRARSKCRTYYDYVGHDHCFAIVRNEWRDGKEPTNFYFQTGPRYTDRLFQTEEEARYVATEEVRDSNRRTGQWQKWSLEHVACSGDPRNRGANQ